MNELRARLSDYAALRRSLGFAAKELDYYLPSFVRYMESKEAGHISTGAALAWATLPAGLLPVSYSQRLGAVRGFARYLANLDPMTEVPPADLLPVRYSRVAPYLYSDDDVSALMAAARNLAPELRGATYETFIGLLAVSGLRSGEAIRLDRADIRRHQLVVRNSKHEAAREVPLHQTALRALRSYAALRDGLAPNSGTSAFFVSTLGKRLTQVTVDAAFRKILAAAGIQAAPGRRRPRLHDLRHSFAVKSVAEWRLAGIDVDARMPALAKVLGHANPASTYWYLQASPELFGSVAGRLDAAWGDQQ
jgi:integrase/recombinase XerD